MLAQDFSIPYEDGRNAGKQPIRPRLRRETGEQKFKRMERHCFRVLSDYYYLLRRWKEEYRDITELDASTLNRLIKEIVVHETIDSDKTRHISIEIHFNLKPIPEVEQVTG